jgi:hypothetical protein
LRNEDPQAEGYFDGAILVKEPTIGGTYVDPEDFSSMARSSENYHELSQVFLGKRKEFAENPTYPFQIRDIEDINEYKTEKGQTYAYHNYSKRRWDLNYQTIPEATYQSIIDMRNHTSGRYKPLWFCLDPAGNPEKTYFVRFLGEKFTYRELIDQTWDVKVSIEEEL